MKVCSKCKRELPFEAFSKKSPAHIWPNTKCVYRPQCRKCRSSSEKARQQDPEVKKRSAETSRAWVERNREKSNSYKYAWRERNSDKVREIEEARKEAKREYLRAWSKTDHGRFIRNSHQKSRMARKRQAVDGGGVSSDQIRALLDKAEKCLLCDVEFCWDRKQASTHPAYPNVDHIVPLAVGGLHELSNLRVICRKCNQSRPRDGRDFEG